MVCLRPMFIRRTTTNDNNTVTNYVAGRWWLQGEQTSSPLT
jgi:hypothetical protein